MKVLLGLSFEVHIRYTACWRDCRFTAAIITIETQQNYYHTMIITDSDHFHPNPPRTIR